MIPFAFFLLLLQATIGTSMPYYGNPALTSTAMATIETSSVYSINTMSTDSITPVTPVMEVMPTTTSIKCDDVYCENGTS